MPKNKHAHSSACAQEQLHGCKPNRKSKHRTEQSGQCYPGEPAQSHLLKEYASAYNTLLSAKGKETDQ